MDEHLLVLDKPAGLLAVPGRGEDKQDCLATRATAMWPDARVVHRLDMATSGLFVMARSLAMQRALSRAFEHREVRKRYVAAVAGAIAEDGQWHDIDLPIAADWPNRPLRKIDSEHGQPSVTRWRVMETHADRTRVEVEPLTGRTHQIRIHLREIGHPILGDTLYAPDEVQAMAPRLLLHAGELGFRHPANGDNVAFASRVPF